MAITVDEIIKMLENDVKLHVVMESANNNPTYGYYAEVLQELVDIIKQKK
jgi:hypothetical protein